MDQGDVSKIRAMFSARAQERMRDEDLVAFHEAVKAKYGAFKRVPDSPVEAWQRLMTVGAAMKDFQGRQDLIPIPVEFENGWVLLIVQIDNTHSARQGPDKQTAIPIVNLYAASPGQERIEVYPAHAVPALLPPDSPALPPPPAPPAPPTDTGGEEAPKDDKK